MRFKGFEPGEEAGPTAVIGKSISEFTVFADLQASVIVGEGGMHAGAAAEGVAWSLRALLTRARHGLGEAALDADTLAKQRAAVGRRGFAQLLNTYLPDQAAAELGVLVAERPV